MQELEDKCVNTRANFIFVWNRIKMIEDKNNTSQKMIYVKIKL